MEYSDTGYYKAPPNIINLLSFTCVLRLAEKSLQNLKTDLDDANLVGINWLLISLLFDIPLYNKIH